jgi:hypothetical protein
MAEITYGDGRKETIAWQGDGTELRKPTMWENARMGTSKQLERVMPPHGAQNVAEFAIPGSTAEAGIQGALALVPGVGPLLGKVAPGLLERSPLVSRMLMRALRVALPAAGGAAGAAAGGQPIGAEAQRGAIYGLAGEGLNAAIENIARATGTGRMEKIDAKNLGAAIKDAVAAFGRPKSTEDLYKLAMTSGGQAALDEARKTALKGITDKLKARVVSGGHPTLGPGARRAGHDAIEVPALREVNGGNALMTLDEAAGWLTRLGSQGWLLTQKVKEGLDAGAARALRGQARNEIVAALDGQVKGLGKEFDQALKQHSKGLSILTFLQQPGIFTKEGHLDMNAVRNALGAQRKATQTETFAQQLEHRLTPEEVQRFYGALFRGGPMTGRDVAGNVGVHGSVHMGTPYVGISRPRLPSFTGDAASLPWWARPGRLPAKADAATRIPLTFGMIGLTREDPGE